MAPGCPGLHPLDHRLYRPHPGSAAHALDGAARGTGDVAVDESHDGGGGLPVCGGHHPLREDDEGEELVGPREPVVAGAAACGVLCIDVLFAAAVVGAID